MARVQQIVDEFRPYRNKRGFVTKDGSVTQNDVLFNAFYVHLLDTLDDEDQATDAGEHREEWVRQYALLGSLMKEPGLLMRAPDGVGGQESHDNIIAALYMWLVLRRRLRLWDKPGYADWFLQYGRDSRARRNGETGSGWWVFQILNLLSGFRGVPFVYNTEDPEVFTLSSWIGRFPHVIALAKVIAGEDLSCSEKTLVSGAFLKAAKDRDSVESRTLMFLMGQVFYTAVPALKYEGVNSGT